VLIASPTAVPSPQAEEKSTSTSSATSGGSPPDSPNSAQTSEEQRKIFAEMLELIDWPKPGSIQKGYRHKNCTYFFLDQVGYSRLADHEVMFCLQEAGAAEQQPAREAHADGEKAKVPFFR
jgi:hypothetical protein